MSFSQRPPGSSKFHGQRSVGDSPDLGPVSKFRPGFDPRSPGNGGGTGRRRKSSSANKLPPPKAARRLILILSGLLALALVCGITWFSMRAPATRDDPRVVLEAGPIQLDSSLNSEKENAPPQPRILEQLARKLATSTEASNLPEELNRNGYSPAEVVSKLTEMRATDGEVSKVSYIGPIPNLTHPLEGVLVTFSGKRNRLVLFSPDFNGKWLLDFGSYSRETSVPWETLGSGSTSEGIVRVYVSQDAYYNGRFSNESEWSCSGLASPDMPTLLFGYVKRKSSADRAIQDALKFKATSGSTEKVKMIRMIIGIRHTEGDDPRQFEITRVIADDWATPVRDLEQNYQ